MSEASTTSKSSNLDPAQERYLLTTLLNQKSPFFEETHILYILLINLVVSLSEPVMHVAEPYLIGQDAAAILWEGNLTLWLYLSLPAFDFPKWDAPIPPLPPPPPEKLKKEGEMDEYTSQSTCRPWRRPSVTSHSCTGPAAKLRSVISATVPRQN